MSSRRPSQRGFTLLEAIVSLVLISSAGMALFAWINGSIAQLHHIQETGERNDALRNTLQYMQTINPMQVPTGEIDLGDYRLRWRAEPITEPADGAGFPYGRGKFRLSLYRTRVETLAESGTVWFAYDLQQVGYLKVRTGASEVQAKARP